MTTSTTSHAVRTDEQRSRWSRLLDAVAPAPNPNRLVPVAEIGRDSIRFVEEGLTEAGIFAVVQRTMAMSGGERYRVLVAARDREIASEVVGA